VKGVPVDLNNKGVGPITSVKFDVPINEKMAALQVFKEKFPRQYVLCNGPYWPRQRIDRAKPN